MPEPPDDPPAEGAPSAEGDRGRLVDRLRRMTGREAADGPTPDEATPDEATPDQTTPDETSGDEPTWPTYRPGGDDEPGVPGPGSAPAGDPPPVEGEVRSRPEGRHLVRSHVIEPGERYGEVELARFPAAPPGPLSVLAGADLSSERMDRALFLDVETTGPGSGAGFRVFLAGLAWFEPDGSLVLEQHFLRDPSDEPALVSAVADRIERHPLVVTYSGKSFDRHSIDARCRFLGVEGPFPRPAHLDLLHACRALWPHHPDGHTLQEMERTFLGRRRVGDLPGAECPRAYLEYLRGLTLRVERVFEHNRDDILALAALGVVVAERGHSPREATETLAVARAHARRRRFEEALSRGRRALDRGLDDPWRRQALRLVGRMAKRLKRWDEAVEAWERLGASPGPAAVEGLVEIAKHAEHRTGDLDRALDVSRRARSWLAGGRLPVDRDRAARLLEEVDHRIERLERRLARASGS